MVKIQRQKPPKPITVNTRKGNSIANDQAYEFSVYEFRFLEEKFKKRFVTAKFRPDPIPIYNCHGKSFASSRTWIYDDTALSQIINEDNIQMVPQDKAMIGDFIFYWGEIEGIRKLIHSGLIITNPSEDMWNPWVISKWGLFREVIHRAWDVPYENITFNYNRIKNGI